MGFNRSETMGKIGDNISTQCKRSVLCVQANVCLVRKCNGPDIQMPGFSKMTDSNCLAVRPSDFLKVMPKSVTEMKYCL